MDSHINQRHPDGKFTDTAQANGIPDTNKIDLRNEIQEEYRSHPIAWPVWVFNSLTQPGISRVLELGSGTGTLWQENSARIPKSWKILLSDSALNMVRKAQTNLSSIPSTVGFYNLDSQSLPFPKGSADVVLAVGLLDLVPDLDRTLSEVCRVLCPAGQLIATAGGKGHLKELEDLLQPFLPPGMAETLGGNEERFGMENGAQLLARYFEEVVRQDYLDQLVFTEMEPILEYVLSEQAIAWSIPLSQLGSFVKSIRRHLNQHGKLVVTVRKGLFVGQKKGFQA